MRVKEGALLIGIGIGTIGKNWGLSQAKQDVCSPYIKIDPDSKKRVTDGRNPEKGAGR